MIAILASKQKNSLKNVPVQVSSKRGIGRND
jgi:hypothetical protein